MNILEELWYGNIEPSEYDTNPDPEYKALLRLISRTEDKLLDTLTAEQKEAFFRYRDCVREYQAMADHYNERISLPAVAEYIQLSPSYFSSLFSQIVGYSFSDYLCRIRIEESKRLLLSTDYSLANIAVAVGFPDQSYFCKAYKRIVGLTPGKFRA